MSVLVAESAFRPHRSLRLLRALHIQSQSSPRTRQHNVMSPTAEELSQQVAQQSALLNDLRKQEANATALEEAKKRLGELKRALGHLTAGPKEDGKKKERILLKTPKVSLVSSCIPLLLLKLTR